MLMMMMVFFIVKEVASKLDTCLSLTQYVPENGKEPRKVVRINVNVIKCPSNSVRDKELMMRLRRSCLS